MLGVSACSGVMDQELRAQVVANNHEVVMGAQAALLVVANLFHQTIQTARPVDAVLDNKKENGKKREEERGTAVHNGETPATLVKSNTTKGVFLQICAA